jgi:hypothetical protein
VSSDKYFNGETADDFVNRFDDINNNLAFEATIEKPTKDMSIVSPTKDMSIVSPTKDMSIVSPAKDTSNVSLELSETISVFVAKISSKNLTNGDHKLDSDISFTLR